MMIKRGVKKKKSGKRSVNMIRWSGRWSIFGQSISYGKSEWWLRIYANIFEILNWRTHFILYLIFFYIFVQKRIFTPIIFFVQNCVIIFVQFLYNSLVISFITCLCYLFDHLRLTLSQPLNQRQHSLN